MPTSVRLSLLLQWWLPLLTAAFLSLLLRKLVVSDALAHEPWSLLFFAIAMSTAFASRRAFHRFKLTVIELGKQPELLRQPAGWHRFLLVRRHVLLLALLPSICAVLAVPLGLPTTPVFLLFLCSCLLFWLYRTPRYLCLLAAVH